jgi:L-alanine-DL-glutamate epimerase-like enolase superfamily enzyme
MKITDLSTHLLTGLWKDDPFFPQNLHSTALIKIETDAGITGWGESTLGYFAPETVPTLVAFWKPVLLGRDPLELNRLTRDLYDESVWWARSGAGRSALSGIELALWDVRGKVLGVPVYQLLGGAARETIPIYASGGPACWPLEENLKKAQFYIEQGFRALKLSTHFYESEMNPEGGCGRLTEIEIPFSELIKQIEANFCGLRKEFNGEIELAIDGHQGGVPNPIPLTEAATIAAILAPHRLRFFEEPLAYTDVESYRALKAQSLIPIAGGESLCGVHEFQNILDGVHIAQPDIGWCGGIEETRKIIEVAQSKNIATAIHTGASFGPSFAASWHLAAASRSVEWLECVVAGSSIQRDLLDDDFCLTNGKANLPSSPGLGVNIADEMLEKYSFVAGSGERT